MTDTLLHDLAPQYAINRLYWSGWDGGAGTDPGSALPTYRTDIPMALLNGVTRVRDTPIVDAIAEARARLDGSRWIWWVGGDSDPGTAEALEAHGATAAGQVPIMAHDLTDLPSAPHVPGLVIGQPGADLHDYVRAYAEPNGIPDGALELTVARDAAYRAPRGTLTRLGARLDGRTVATTTLLVDGDVAGIFCVASLEAYRNRGISFALTAEALRRARDTGARLVSLTASDLGERVYRRAGFTPVGRYRFYLL